MNTSALSPIVSVFSTQAQADAYDIWFKAKVQASINDTRPRVPHDQAIIRIQTRLQQKRLAIQQAAL